MVTSTASGLAVPDWQLSYGQWLPRMTGGSRLVDPRDVGTAALLTTRPLRLRPENR